MEVKSLFDVKDKVVFVTGGGKGVGEHIAEGFIVNGAHVYITGRKVEDLKITCERLNKLGPGSCKYIQGNLTNEKDLKEIINFIKQNEKKIHVLVNNAGVTWGSELEGITPSSYNRVMDLNLKALLFFIIGLLPLLEEDSSEEDPSRIINIGSLSGLRPGSNRVVYDVSKAAVHHLGKVLASQLASKSILVNSIALGFYETKMTKGMIELVGKQNAVKGIPMKRAGKPIEIAGTCLFLASKASGFITGTTISVDGGLHIKSSPL